MNEAPLTTPSNSSIRTCAGCGAAIDHRAEQDGSASVRVVRGPDGAIAIDAKGGAFGRGAHVHTRPDCIAKAAERGLARSFKAACKVTAASLAAEIASALDRRIEGLLLTAGRTQAIVIGADEAAFLVVVAVDADADEIASAAGAVAAGRAVAWGTKQIRTNEKKPAGVIAITSEKIARALAEAVRAKGAALATSDAKFNSRRMRGEAAREAAIPKSKQAERGA